MREPCSLACNLSSPSLAAQQKGSEIALVRIPA
jgi:hypothetical protein